MCHVHYKKSQCAKCKRVISTESSLTRCNKALCEPPRCKRTEETFQVVEVSKQECALCRDK